MNNNQFGRSILLKCSSAAKMFLSDVYKKGTQAKKYQADGRQCGRSMIEMLGVLAIIGVLSVGAIAGYQKAMFKYKLNKYSEQLNQVVNSIVKHSRSFDTLGKNNLGISTNSRITDYFIKMGEIPIEMIKNRDDVFYDIFGFTNHIALYHDETKQHADTIHISLFTYANNMDDEVMAFEICKTYLNVAKENQNNISYMELQSNLGGETHKRNWLCGNANCSRDGIYLKDLTIELMHEKCQALVKNKVWQIQIGFE